MEQLITCKICFEDKDTNIVLEHINPTCDVSEHQLCEDCYKSMTKNECPFCRCEIIIPEPEPKPNTIESAASELPNLTQVIRNIQNGNYNPENRNLTYFQRLDAGLIWPDGSPKMYSN